MRIRPLTESADDPPGPSCTLEFLRADLWFFQGVPRFAGECSCAVMPATSRARPDIETHLSWKSRCVMCLSFWPTPKRLPLPLPPGMTGVVPGVALLLRFPSPAARHGRLDASCSVHRPTNLGEVRARAACGQPFIDVLRARVPVPPAPASAESVLLFCRPSVRSAVRSAAPFCRSLLCACVLLFWSVSAAPLASHSFPVSSRREYRVPCASGSSAPPG
jgi:hypothetical protein